MPAEMPATVVCCSFVLERSTHASRQVMPAEMPAGVSEIRGHLLSVSVGVLQMRRLRSQLLGVSG